MSYTRSDCDKMLRLGVNVSGSLKFGRRRGSKWKGMDFMQDSSQKLVSDKWLSEKFVSSVPMKSGSTVQEVRLRDLFLIKLKQRQKFSRMYGYRVRMTRALIDRRLSKSMSLGSGSDLLSNNSLSEITNESVGSLESKNTMESVKRGGKSSLLSDLESRLAVVLWRSGLVKSVSMGVRLVLNGDVLVQLPSGELMSSSFPSHVLVPGTMVTIKSKVWGKRAPQMLSYWKEESNQRGIPGHLYVSMSTGSVVRVDRPCDGEVLVPTSMSFSIHSFYRG